MRFKTIGIAVALIVAAVGLHGQIGFGGQGGAGRIATVSITQDTDSGGIETWQLAAVRAKDGSVKTSVVYASTETGAFMRARATDSTLNAPFEGKWSGIGTWCGKACTWRLSAAAMPPMPNNALAITQAMGVRFSFVAKTGNVVVCKRDATITDGRCLVVVFP